MGERRRRRKAQLHLQNSREYLNRGLRVVMAVSIAASSAGIVSGGTSRTISYSHTAGNDLCAIIIWRGTSITISSVTYNSASLSLIVASGQAAEVPGMSASAYRINDPGTLTANLVVTFSGTVGGDNVYIIDVSGCQETSPVESSSASMDPLGTANISSTHTRIANNTFTILAGGRIRGASACTFTGRESETEIFDEDQGTNPGLCTCLYTLQEVASGSLNRGITATTIGSFAMVCLSYTTAGQPFLKRWGGIRFAAGARKGLW